MCVCGEALREWKRSVGELPIWSLVAGCGCWPSSESLPVFTYLFF